MRTSLHALCAITSCFLSILLAKAAIALALAPPELTTIESFSNQALDCDHNLQCLPSLRVSQRRRGLVLEYILAQDYDSLDLVDEDRKYLNQTTYSLSSSYKTSHAIAGLIERGAHRCWHKHSTFLQHLVGTHDILRLWGESKLIGHVALFHSAYSNSYVNTALFDRTTEREAMQKLIGLEAENLVHLFCIIDRQEVVVNTLLKQGYIPREGLRVPHLRKLDEVIDLSPETLRMLVVFTMADIADQYFGWQDTLFGGGGDKGSMIIPGQDSVERHDARAIWPGISKPGLWMSYVSKLAKVASTYDPSWQDKTSRPLGVPPVFERCTQTLSVEDEVMARDLFWRVIMDNVPDDETAISTLQESIQKNPWAFEPYVLLAQKLLHAGDFDGALMAAQRALDLEHQWGTAWDKRLGFGAWVAWTRVLLQHAQGRTQWPINSWDVNNLGLVE